MRIIKEIKILPSAILLSALFLIALGIAGGQHLDVLEKAIRVCLECIGIG